MRSCRARHVALAVSRIRLVTSDPVSPARCRGFRIGTNVPGIKVGGTFFIEDGVVFYDSHDPKR